MKTRSKTVVLAGFAAMLTLVIVLMLIWMRSVQTNSARMESIVRETREQELMFNMRDAAHKRALSLFRMAAMDDPFERDDEYLRFKEYATDFIKSRDELLREHLSTGERPIWERAQPTVVRGSVVQNEAVELILDERTTDAHKVLHDNVMPIQESVMTQLTQMLGIAQESVHNQLNDALNDNRTTFVVVAALGSSVMLIGIFIALFVIRRSGTAEQLLIDSSDRLRALYDTASTAGMSHDAQIEAMLRHGCEFLDLELAKVSRIDDARQTNTFVHTWCRPPLDIKPGTVIPLDNTFCSIAVDATGPLALPNVGKSKYAGSLFHTFSGLNAYIAAPLRVNGALYGTVNFASRAPRSRAFSESDLDLVRLIASWIGVSIERAIAQRELSAAKETAESASRAKSTFVANMSHEIRTPLTAIIGYANSLNDARLSGDERARAIDTVVRSSQHLAQVINDILDLSKIEAGQLKTERIDMSVHDVVAEVESVIAMQARDKGLAFTVNYRYPLPERIQSDPVRIKQILLNLCANAVKFTQKGQVEINVEYDAPAHRLVLRVGDTGIGMTAEEMQQLFKPFSQTDVSTTRRFGGTGLGLWISQQLANKLGGNIRCTSEKGHGSEFVVTVDAGTATPRMVNQFAATAATPTTMQIPELAGSILLAEDSVEVQDLIGMYVRRTGADIAVVGDGRQAVERALTRDFDLVLMDMQMPVMDGIAAISLLRRSGYTRPLVSLTANAMRDDRERCAVAGADDFIGKPVDVAHFYEVLRRYVPARTGKPASAPTQITASLDDDPEYRELVNRFLDGLPAMATEMAHAAATQEWESLRGVVHKLKGMGGGFGFPDITEAAATFHEELRAGDRSRIDVRLAALNDMIQRACATRRHAA